MWYLPYLWLREKTGKKQKKYFRVFNDENIIKMAKTEIIKEVERINEYRISLYQLNKEELAKILISYQRKRHLQFWQDGSRVSNNDHILTMVNSVYDRAIFSSSLK